jgi:reactive intermediate/imine deaminase
MSRTEIKTPEAPAPMAGAPYAQGVVWNDVVFTSGQVPVDPVSNKIVGEDIGTQTEQALRNLAAVLEAGGSGLTKILKTTVFLSDLADWAGMNEVYARVVGKPVPARSAVGVQLPAGIRVEIEAVGHR